jgi:hypothetical protein
VTTYKAGEYIGCGACGRLLKIHWPARSIVCSCGARITPPQYASATPAPAADAGPKPPPEGKPK